MLRSTGAAKRVLPRLRKYSRQVVSKGKAVTKFTKPGKHSFGHPSLVGNRQDKLRRVLSCFLRYPHLAKTKLEECARAERVGSVRAVTVVDRVRPSDRPPMIFQVGAQFLSVLFPRCTEEIRQRNPYSTFNPGFQVRAP